MLRRVVTSEATAQTPRGRWPSETTESALRRVAFLWVAAWLLIQTVAIGTEANEVISRPSVAYAAVGFALLTWFLCLMVPQLPPALLVASLALLAMGLMLLLEPPQADTGGQVVFWLPNLVVISAAMLLGRQGSLRVVVGAPPVVAGLLIAMMWNDGAANRWHIVITTVCYLAFDGAAAFIVVSALRDAASKADTAIAVGEAGRQEQLEVEASVVVSTRLSASLHDTVINTLGAVAQPAGVTDMAMVRSHCQAAVAVIDSLLSVPEPEDWPASDLTAPTWEGILPSRETLAVTLQGTSSESLTIRLAQLPPPVARALAGAMSEAFRNIVKHSRRDYANVSVEDARALRIAISDDGVGFDTEILPEGRGLANSVIGRCRSVGIDVNIHSRLGSGTRLVFTVDGNGRAAESRQAQESSSAFVDSLAQPFVRKFSWCMLGLACALTAVGPSPLENLTSWTAVAILWLCVLLGTRAPWLPIRNSVLLISLVPMLVVLPGYQEPGCLRVGSAWWGTDAALVPLTCLIFLARDRWPIILGFGSFIASVVGLSLSLRQVGCDSAVTVAGLLDLSIGLGLLYFRHRLLRLGARAASEVEESYRARARSAIFLARVRMHRAQISYALASSRALLFSIASGQVDPRTSTVQRICSREESYLRQVTQLDPRLVNLGPRLVAALGRAHERGVDLLVRVGQVDAPTPAAGATVGAVALAAVESAQAGLSMVLSAFERQNGPVITLVAPIGTLPEASLFMGTANNSGWRLSTRDIDDQTRWELKWTL